MALTVNPVVSRGQVRWVGHCMSFAVGVFFGSLLSLVPLLVAFQLIGTFVPNEIVTYGVVAVIAWAVMQDLGLTKTGLPYRQSQVPDWFKDALPPIAVAFSYGAMLGVGFLTLFTYSTHVAMLAALLFLDSLAPMLFVLSAFALSKSFVLLAARGVTSSDQISSRFRWSPQRMAILRATTATVSLITSAVLVLSL